MSVYTYLVGVIMAGPTVSLEELMNAIQIVRNNKSLLGGHVDNGRPDNQVDNSDGQNQSDINKLKKQIDSFYNYHVEFSRKYKSVNDELNRSRIKESEALRKMLKSKASDDIKERNYNDALKKIKEDRKEIEKRQVEELKKHLAKQEIYGRAQTRGFSSIISSMSLFNKNLLDGSKNLGDNFKEFSENLKRNIPKTTAVIGWVGDMLKNAFIGLGAVISTAIVFISKTLTDVSSSLQGLKPLGVYIQGGMQGFAKTMKDANLYADELVKVMSENTQLFQTGGTALRNQYSILTSSMIENVDAMSKLGYTVDEVASSAASLLKSNRNLNISTKFSQTSMEEYAKLISTSASIMGRSRKELLDQLERDQDTSTSYITSMVLNKVVPGFSASWQKTSTMIAGSFTHSGSQINKALLSFSAALAGATGFLTKDSVMMRANMYQISTNLGLTFDRLSAASAKGKDSAELQTELEINLMKALKDDPLRIAFMEEYGDESQKAMIKDLKEKDRIRVEFLKEQGRNVDDIDDGWREYKRQKAKELEEGNKLASIQQRLGNHWRKLMLTLQTTIFAENGPIIEAIEKISKILESKEVQEKISNGIKDIGNIFDKMLKFFGSLFGLGSEEVQNKAYTELSNSINDFIRKIFGRSPEEMYKKLKDDVTELINYMVSEVGKVISKTLQDALPTLIAMVASGIAAKTIIGGIASKLFAGAATTAATTGAAAATGAATAATTTATAAATTAGAGILGTAATIAGAGALFTGAGYLASRFVEERDRKQRETPKRDHFIRKLEMLENSANQSYWSGLRGVIPNDDEDFFTFKEMPAFVNELKQSSPDDPLIERYNKIKAKMVEIDASNASKFATGAILNSPISFPMKGGRGLAGEAGPEVIAPYPRDGILVRLNEEYNKVVISEIEDHINLFRDFTNTFYTVGKLHQDKMFSEHQDIYIKDMRDLFNEYFDSKSDRDSLLSSLTALNDTNTSEEQRKNLESSIGSSSLFARQMSFQGGIQGFSRLPKANIRSDNIPGGGSNSGSGPQLTNEANVPNEEIPRMIADTAKRMGFDPALALGIAKTESNFNPNNGTGSYHGLFQLSSSTWAEAGGGNNRNDPRQQAEAGINLLLKRKQEFIRMFKREPEPWELYMFHQQGPEGTRRLLENPDKRAADVRSLKAIEGNLPSAMRHRAGTMTAREFTNVWRDKFNNNLSQYVPGSEGRQPDESQYAGYGKGAGSVITGKGTGFSVSGNVNISGVNPTFLSNFQKAANEYHQATGRSLNIYSGFRSVEHQKRLYDKYIASGKSGAPVAVPGKSMHNFGYALDVGPNQNANEAASLGILGRNNIHRPMSYEPWHLEPTNINRAEIRNSGGSRGGIGSNTQSSTPDVPIQQSSTANYTTQESEGNRGTINSNEDEISEVLKLIASLLVNIKDSSKNISDNTSRLSRTSSV